MISILFKDMSMFEAIISYLDFMLTQLSNLATPFRIWCFYEQFGLRTILVLVNSGIIAFALPNILDQSECKMERDAYIKSLFERKHFFMKLNSCLMLFFSVVTILTYLAIWSAVLNHDVCGSSSLINDSPVRFAGVLAAANILAILIAMFALNQKIFCIKHKQ